MSKNIEYLEVYKEYKVFLDNLFTTVATKEDKEEMFRQQILKKKKFKHKEEMRQIDLEIQQRGALEQPLSLE